MKHVPKDKLIQKMPNQLIIYEHVTQDSSTNDHLLARVHEIQSEPHKIIVRSCDQQTQGRGQQYKKWHAPSNALLCSIALTYQPQGMTSLIVGLAIIDCLVTVYPELIDSLKIKWPNDLLIKNEKNEFFKVGGILLEYRQGVLIIGFGVNLHEEKQGSKLQSHCILNSLNSLNSLNYFNHQKIYLIQQITTNILKFLEESKSHFSDKHQLLWHQYSALSEKKTIDQGIYQGINFATGGVIIDGQEYHSISLNWHDLYRYEGE